MTMPGHWPVGGGRSVLASGTTRAALRRVVREELSKRSASELGAETPDGAQDKVDAAVAMLRSELQTAQQQDADRYAQKYIEGVIASGRLSQAALIRTIDARVEVPARAAGADAAIDVLAKQPEVTQEAATRAGALASDPAMAANIASPTSATRAEADKVYAGRGRAMPAFNINAQPGVVGDGVTDDTAALQAALNAAATFGLRAAGHGTFRTTGTLTITADADLADVKINYHGTGTAVRVTGHSLNVRAPKVENMGTRWHPGTIGLDITDTDQSTIHVSFVCHFDTGVRVHGNTTSCCYNTVHLNDLRNNKVNLALIGTESGWPNQNTFIGGRFWHYGLTTENQPGTRHIQLGAPGGTGFRANNNTFINPSIEGTPGLSAEYAIDFERASDNVFIGARFENTGVRWTSNAQRNMLIGGYGLHSLAETGDRGDNAIIGPRTLSLAGNPSGALLTLRQTGGYGAEAVRVCDPLDGARRWAIRGHDILGRRSTDTHERVILNGATSSLQLGDGAGTYVTLGYASSGHLRLEGGNLIASPDNTYDIGLSSNYRPRDINAARNVNAGLDVLVARHVNAGQDVRATRYVMVGNAYMRESGGVLQASLSPSGPWKNVLDLN